MAIKILTDSTSDIMPQEARERGLALVPLRVAFGEELFRDNMDITHQEFYAKLAQSEALPTTSQPTPDDFLPFFEAARDNGDQLICILLSGGLSGTVQSATIAKDIADYDGIYVVDSCQAVIGLRLLVDLACVLREEGKCIIAIFVPEAAPEQKPVYLANDPWRHTYRRVGEADKRCSREEVAAMLKRSGI